MKATAIEVFHFNLREIGPAASMILPSCVHCGKVASVGDTEWLVLDTSNRRVGLHPGCAPKWLLAELPE